MVRKLSKRFQPLLITLGISGLICLFLSMRKRKDPQSVIRQVLTQAGIDKQTVNQWIAVSALETAGWTSKVFLDSNNLFALIVPGKKGIGYGEGQTIFATLEEAAQGLVRYVINPFKYPYIFSSIPEQAQFMKSKGYYGGDSITYGKGMKIWFDKLNLQ